MPTGYTQIILNDDVTTGKDFLKSCAIDFCIAGREGWSLEDVKNLKPHNYYKNLCGEYYCEQQKLQNMSKDELRTYMISEHNEEIELDKKALLRCENENKKLIKVRKEIEKWECPVAYTSLKEFALNQIDISMNSDELIDLYKTRINLNQTLDTSDEAVDAWYNSKMQELADNLDYASKKYEEEIDRVNQQKQWVGQLLENLENI